MASELWGRNIGLAADIARAAAALLSAERPTDSVGNRVELVVKVTLVYPNRHVSDKHMRKVLHSNAPLRVGLSLLLPLSVLSGPKGVAVGVARVERRPVGSVDGYADAGGTGEQGDSLIHSKHRSSKHTAHISISSDTNTNNRNSNRNSGGLSSLAIIDEEEAALRVLCQLCTPSLDRVYFYGQSRALCRPDEASASSIHKLWFSGY